jgi:hypothetical protein
MSSGHARATNAAAPCNQARREAGAASLRAAWDEEGVGSNEQVIEGPGNAVGAVSGVLRTMGKIKKWMPVWAALIAGVAQVLAAVIQRL